jgi:hypothetical protein
VTHDLDRPVLVIDLRETLAAAAQSPPDEVIDEPVELCAIVHDALPEPLVLPLPSGLDREELDAIARLVRFAVERRERIPNVAIAHGGELERRLAFERRLPKWAYDGLDRMPPELEATLGKK